ncbi:hypothetical protein ACW5WU_09225 [Aeromonas encheleia]|nr:hypothetical protein [Aeromonas encheleia]
MNKKEEPALAPLSYLHLYLRPSSLPPITPSTSAPGGCAPPLKVIEKREF